MAMRERPRPGAATSAGRVIAGVARGARLVGPGPETRPLGDRVKQTLFAILEPFIRDRPFLDLFAGSGAAGIEALSRGASSAVFVESDRAAVESIRRNLEATGLGGAAAVVERANVHAWLATASRRGPVEAAPGPYAAIFIDPPYNRAGDLGLAIDAIGRAGPGVLLRNDGQLVAKHFWKTAPAANPLLRSVREERFGETMLTFYRWSEGDEG